METNNIYNMLKEYKQQYPKLTFDNDGYEYLSIEIKESHKKQIEEINNILKKIITGYVEFNNFKPQKNGSFSIRYQYNWNEHFIGVGYANIEDFKQANNIHI